MSGSSWWAGTWRGDKQAGPLLCDLCGHEATGPMLRLGLGIGHAECVAKALRELLDPDWEPGREPTPLPGSFPCHSGEVKKGEPNIETVTLALHGLIDQVVKTCDFEEELVIAAMGGKTSPLLAAYLAACNALGIKEVLNAEP